MAQRLGERHLTKDLVSFLQDFHNSGALPPLEVVSDESKAILNAAVTVYSNSSDIEEYADSIVDLERVTTRIRIDVAHFQNKYKNLLKGLPSRIFTFYMASIGQLIMSQDIEESARIIEALFLIANCETEGKLLSTGEPSQCSEYKTWLKGLITSKSFLQVFV